MNKLDKRVAPALAAAGLGVLLLASGAAWAAGEQDDPLITPVSYTHLRAHET